MHDKTERYLNFQFCKGRITVLALQRPQSVCTPATRSYNAEMFPHFQDAFCPQDEEKALIHFRRNNPEAASKQFHLAVKWAAI